MIGQSVGPYQILEQLGSGGMGVVYKAHDTRLDRTVALKFLPPQLSQDSKAKDRFVQEARAASALDHAHICTIHDIGTTDDGQLFIVMTFYDGNTLKYLLEDGQLEIDQAVQIALQIARGLGRAHEAGIVHRDVKPANIMVTERGEVKVLDFGVAKLVTAADLTSEGSTIGTAAYMSPEQSRGDAVDPRADQWSLGVVLYEMLTGCRPFAGGYDAAMLYAILNEAPAPVESLRPEIPPELAGLVNRCLLKNPEDRFPTADAMADELSRILGGTGESTAAISGSEQRARRVLSSSRIALAFALVAALTLALLYAAMIRFGLPDWVFSVGLILVAMGLPIMIFSGRFERRRQAMGTAERDSLSGIARWVSVRKAIYGGFVAMGGLSVLAASFMILRAAGIGPAATLISSGALDDQSTVVFAEFENRTQDPNLGKTVTEAFRIDLSESPVVSVLGSGAIGDALSRMERSDDAEIDVQLAREIAERVGAKAVVAGDISSVGAGYVLSARLLVPADGAELLALRENAADDTQILNAIDELSGRLRERVGESLVTIRADRPLEDVTTGSLEALRMFTEADALADRGQFEESRDLLEQAIAVDSTFGMAYRKLAVVRGNAGASSEDVASAARRAYDLRDGMSEREALLAEAYFHNVVEWNPELIIGAYERLLEKWPNDLAALNNLAIQYNNRNRFEEAAGLVRRALALQEGVVFRTNLVEALANLERWDEVRAELDSFAVAHPTVAAPEIFRARLNFKEGDSEGAESLLDSVLTSFDLVDNLRWGASLTRQTMAQHQGQYRRSLEIGNTVADELADRGIDNAAFSLIVGGHIARAYALDDFSQLLGTLQDLERRFPIDSMFIGDRPDVFIAIIHAFTGNPAQARSVLDKWRNDVPEEIRGPEPFLANAFIAEAEGRPNDAFRALEEGRKELVCDDCWWNIEGDMYVRLDSVDKAIAAYEKHRGFPIGLGIFEEEAPISYRLGLLYESRGDYDQALREFSTVLDVWKNADPETRPILEDAQERINRILDSQAREPSAVPEADS